MSLRSGIGAPNVRFEPGSDMTTERPLSIEEAVSGEVDARV
jgi:hypothetical protein